MADITKVEACLLRDKGVISLMLEHSVENRDDYVLETVKIDSTGSLSITSSIKLIDRLHSCQLQIIGNNIIYVKSFNESQHIYLKPASSTQFNQLFAALIIWQSLKPKGISYKRQTIKYTESNAKIEKLLVCTCEIYGFLPKIKNLSVLENNNDLFVNENNFNWFSAKVVLNSNGILDLINESDSQLIYSIDIKLLKSSEIKKLNHSLFQSSNYLFIGVLKKLRNEGIFKNSANASTPHISSFSNKIDKLILKFNCEVALEDWLINLNLFTIKELVGHNNNLLKISKKIKFDILEADLTQNFNNLYVEIQIWDKIWFRTSIVSNDTNNKNPFFKEEFEIDLPVTTNQLIILLKYSKDLNYNYSDKILGASIIEYKKFKSNNFNNKIPIFNINNNEKIGQFFINSSIKRNYILSTKNFNNLEKILLNLDLIEFHNYITTDFHNLNLENLTLILLDVFQSLKRECDWLNVLIQQEVKVSLDQPNDNIIFRGNSILTKTLEFYNFRVGKIYLNKIIGEFINDLIENFKPIEIDPLRIKEENKDEIIEKNFQNLLELVKALWSKIYKSSNDVPIEIKNQLSNLRTTINLYSNNDLTTFNSISSFIFLRFFIPVLLNPKIFKLTRNHQFGDIKRCLTLISKILMKFANRQEFDLKEPYLIKFNEEFLIKHRDELFDYLDKITLKKLDFTESSLHLDPIREIQFISKDSLTLPYLIDKYLRFDQLIDILTIDIKNEIVVDDFGYGPDNLDESDLLLIDEDNSNKIGSLEFENLNLINNDDNNFEFGDDKFFKKLLKTEKSQEILKYIDIEIKLDDFKFELNNLRNKKINLIKILSNYEKYENLPENFLNNLIINEDKKILIINEDSKFSKNQLLLKSFNNLKLKFENDQNNFNSINKTPIKSKKISKLIRSASLNTISSFSIKDDKIELKSKGSLISKLFKR